MQNWCTPKTGVVKTRRAYLAAYGYKKWVSGFTRRPVLTYLLDHVHNMMHMVTADGLSYPKTCDLPGVLPLADHALDGSTFAARLKQNKMLDHEVRKYGRYSDHWMFV